MDASRKLTPYFHAHPIEVLTNYPLHQVLQKPEASGKLLKWAIELGQFEVNFRPRTVIKGQTLADCIAEFTYSNAVEVAGTTNNTKVVGVREKYNSVLIEEDTEQWTLYVDDASNDTESGADMMLISPKGHKIHCVIRFRFKALNNKAEYKALIAGLHLAHELQVHNVKIFSDSQLVVNQVNDIYRTRGEKMVTYLDKAKEQLSLFFAASIEVIPRCKNCNADALAKLDSTRDVGLLDVVSVEFLAELSVPLQQGGNLAHIRIIMDGPHRRVPENWWIARG